MHLDTRSSPGRSPCHSRQRFPNGSCNHGSLTTTVPIELRGLQSKCPAMSTLSFLTRLSHRSLNCACRDYLSSTHPTFTTPNLRRTLSIPVPSNVRHLKALPKHNLLSCDRLRTVRPAPAFLGIQHQMSPNLEFAGLDGMKYVLFWYASSMIYSAYNKKALRVFPYPLLLSAAQLAISSAIAVASWTVYNRQLDAFACSRVLVFAALLHAFCHAVDCASSSTQRTVTNGRVRCMEALLVLFGMRALVATEVKAWVKACVSISTLSLSSAIAEVEDVSNDARVIALTSGLVVASVLRGLCFQNSLWQGGGSRTCWYGTMTLLALLSIGPLGALSEGREALHSLQSLASTQATVVQHLMAWVAISGVATYFSGLFYFHVILGSNVLTAAVANVVRPVVCMIVWGTICRIPMLRRTALASYATMLGLAVIVWTT